MVDRNGAEGVKCLAALSLRVSRLTFAGERRRRFFPAGLDRRSRSTAKPRCEEEGAKNRFRVGRRPSPCLSVEC